MWVRVSPPGEGKTKAGCAIFPALLKKRHLVLIQKLKIDMKGNIKYAFSFCFILSCLLYALPVSAQQTWARTYGGKRRDKGKVVQQTADGGFIVAGENSSFDGNKVYLIKTDASGERLWEKTCTMSGMHRIYYFQQSADSGYLIAVRTIGSADALHYYLIKTDQKGDTLWTKPDEELTKMSSQGGTLWENGGYITVGSIGGGDIEKMDVYLVKTDAAGETLWTRTYGGKKADMGSAVQQTSDGSYIVVGSTRSFGAGDYDVYLIKTDSLGNVRGRGRPRRR